MTESQGFWSYVHADDERDGGRIVQLVHDIVAEYGMKTSETINLFLDRDDLAWGSEWQATIDGSLASVAFFIPVITPRYFLSPACRAEFNSFARRAADLGVEQLLLPILYVDVPELADDVPSDELVALVKRYQWVDWRELRFAERNSAEYRRAVSQLADRLVVANRDAERAAATDEAIVRAETSQEDFGSMELLAAFETAIPALTATTVAIGDAISDISAATNEAGEMLNEQGTNSSFARRLLVLRQFAEGLREPSGRIDSLSEDFARQLHDVDLGVRLIIERAPHEPENEESFNTFFDSVRAMVTSANEGLGALKTMIDAAAPLEGLSRDIRPPLRDMRRGLTRVHEGLGIMNSWIGLLDSED